MDFLTATEFEQQFQPSDYESDPYLALDTMSICLSCTLPIECCTGGRERGEIRKLKNAPVCPIELKEWRKQ